MLWMIAAAGVVLVVVVVAPAYTFPPEQASEA